jgi:hypothetical protein
MMRKSRCRSASCDSSVGNRSGHDDGSSTICAKITARAAANGRRAHHRCNVEGCPCRIDFSRAEAMLIASSGKRDFDQLLAGLDGHEGAAPLANMSFQSMLRLVTPNSTSSDPVKGCRT